MESRGVFSYENFVHALAGSAGSVVALTSFFPLDTIRSRLQLEDDRESRTTLAAGVELVKEEGVWTLYRGMVPVLQSLCVSNFVYFYAFHGLKGLFIAKDQNALRDLAFGCVAGALNVLTTTPLWVVNSRMKMQGAKMRKAPSGQSGNVQPGYEEVKLKYKNIIHGLSKISEEEGATALWSGTVPSLMLVSNPAIQFMVYEFLKRRTIGNGGGKKELMAITYFCMGAMAKTVATVFTYPLQIVQSRLRFGGKYQGVHKSMGVLEIMRTILRTQGFIGLYKGLEAKLLQTVLSAALMFLCYEKITSFVFFILGVHKKLNARS
ncbi:unnamed protein product [Notodromas monacha]|uniref:Peroxisomal membrane protein PMP34 n=1 Tax=Notodromas monacha TaxID=399045 RepID=A0A7R9BKM3_9CRUS|nr:unnamed protein product [Notodromas monacha]CAG0916444.1 unnamed protein product [Notodromas monacha]